MNDTPELTMENLDAANRDVAVKLGMKPRRNQRTNHILPATRDALTDQFAASADEIIRLKSKPMALYMASMTLLGVLVGAVLAWGLK